MPKPGPRTTYKYSDEFKATAASYGLQVGVQSSGYALVLMTDGAVQHIETSSGYEGRSVSCSCCRPPTRKMPYRRGRS